MNVSPWTIWPRLPVREFTLTELDKAAVMQLRSRLIAFFVNFCLSIIERTNERTNERTIDEWIPCVLLLEYDICTHTCAPNRIK